MADSLVLTGVKQVTKHTGSEMLRMNPKRGGDTHKIKRWWTPGTKGTVYTACVLFQCVQGGDTVFLAIRADRSETLRIRIDLADDGSFSFYDILGTDRAALFSENMELMHHYAFPSISGGKIMKITNTPAPPPAPAVTTIDSVSIAGEINPTAGDTETYTVTAAGDATPFTYIWGTGGSGTIDSGQGTTSVDVTWSTAGSAGISCQVSSSNADFDGNDVTENVNITVAPSFADKVASADYSIAVTVQDAGGSDKYFLTPGGQQAEVTAAAGEVIHFDLSDASLSGHPFKIYTDSSKTTAVTVGIEQEGTDLLFTPPIAGSFSYQCQNHADMGGDITISA